MEIIIALVLASAVVCGLIVIWTVAMCTAKGIGNIRTNRANARDRAFCASVGIKW